MPIIRDRPDTCYRYFAQYLNHLFRQVFGRTEQVRFWSPASDPLTARVGIHENQTPRLIRLNTKFGNLFFTAEQTVAAIKQADGYRLETHRYAYKVCPDESWGTNAIIRWEYVKFGPSHGPPRHHVQCAASVPHNGHAIDLNRLHTPTGWVTFEEVLRFLITELGVTPATEDWAKVLSGGEKTFFEQFTGKRYHAPGEGAGILAWFKKQGLGK